MASMNVMDARRFVKVGQLAAAVLGLSAAAMWAADVPGLSRTLPPKPPAPAVTADQNKPATVAVAKLDKDAALDMAERFEKLASVKKDTTAPPPPPPPPPPDTDWTYLGPIQEASRLLALISTGDHQKVLAEGRKYGDTRLVSVMSDEIVVENASGRHHIKRSERNGSAVAWVKTMPANLPPTGGAPVPGMAGNNGAISPEVAARLRAQGIDPEQANRFRQQQRDRRNRGRDGSPGGPGGNGGGPPGSAPGMTFTTGANGAVATSSGDVVVRQGDDVTIQKRRAAPGKSDAEANN